MTQHGHTVGSSSPGDWRCVYCDRVVADERSACCGEVGHVEWVTDEEILSERAEANEETP